MAKKSPQLQVVGGAVKVQPYDIVSLDQLGESERERLQAALADIEDGAGTLGVMRGVRSWDLRPVVMIFGESGPSMVRLVGPEVAHSKQITEALSAHFKRQQKASANVFEWGTYQGQIWYRRPLFDRTLDAVLDSKLLPTAKDAFAIAEQLVKVVKQWHRQGVVHGHVSPANVALSMENKVSLFDAGVAYAIVQATRELGFEEFPQGYERETFAPEILARGAISYSTDIFGLGYVFEQLFSNVSAQDAIEGVDDITAADLQAVIEFSHTMQLPELHNRPQLTQVEQFIINRGRPEAAPQLAAGQEAQKEKIKLTRRENLEPEVVAPTPRVRETEAVSSSTRSRVDTQSLKKEEVVERVVQARDIEINRETKVEPEVTLAQPVHESKSDGNARLDSYGSTIPEDRLQPSNLEGQSSPKRKLPSWLLYAVAAIVVVGIFFKAGIFDSSRQEVALLTDSDLVAAWNSGLPSRMSLVAQAAVHPDFPNESARTLMLKSAMNAEELPSFNGALLRVAFSPEWEVELSEADRRVAYALSAVELLHKDLPNDLPKLSELHPGLIFAVTATGGKNVASLLSQIPAARLTELPSPYRQAFKVLIKESPEVTSGSPEVMELARFAAYGVRDTARLVAYLEGDNRDFSRIRSLAYLLSQDPVRARELLNVLVGNQTTAQAVNHELVNWARQWQLYNWTELDSTDQLLLLAGVPIQTQISSQNVYKLLLHPIVGVRSSGLERLLAQQQFRHPAGAVALSWAKENASQLSPKQTFRLSQIIFNFQTVTVAAIKDWLTTNPPQELVQILLVGTSGYNKELPLDFELLQYLQGRNWKPTTLELKQLIKHPLRTVRLFAYGKLFSEVDKDTAVVLLLEARKTETEPEFIDQIERNIAVLSKE